MAEMPPVPLTLEGSYVLHQIFRFARPAWRQQEVFHCDRIVQHAVETLGGMSTGTKGGQPNPSAIYSMIGHKGDLMFVHFRSSLEDLHRAELAIAEMELTDFLEPTHSTFLWWSSGCMNRRAKPTRH